MTRLYLILNDERTNVWIIEKLVIHNDTSHRTKLNEQDISLCT